MAQTGSAEYADGISTTLTTGRSLVLLQLLSRCVTFGLNQSLVRLASPEVFGTAAIQFDLVCSTILFLSREGIRNALIRSKTGDHAADAARETQARALSVVPLQLGMIVTIIVCGMYLYTSSTATTKQSSFYMSFALYVLSSLLELAIEPLYLRALRSSPPRISVRIQAEGGMAIVKAAVTVISLIMIDRSPLLGFALGQLAGAAWLAGRYLWEYGDLKSLFWIPIPKTQNRFDSHMLSLAVANTRQSVIKHVLTEADRIAVGRISPLGDQGGYALAINYGSLVARIIFQPLEETLLLHFSKSLSSPSTLYLLTFVIHVSSHLLLFFPTFLPPLLPALLPILLPRRYLNTSAPIILETYLKWYLPLLSLNGILEAFHASSATPGQVANQAKWMIGSSGFFAIGLYTLVQLPRSIQIGTEQSLIYASCLAMLMRIAYAWLHATSYFAGRNERLSILKVLPKLRIVIAAVTSGSILRVLEKTGRWKDSWLGWLQLIGLGAILGLGVLGMLWRVERVGVLELKKVMQGGKIE